MDAILLIGSDRSGLPQRNGPTAHFVRVGGPGMHSVNQMTSGGRWPGSDCAPAEVRSALLDRGKDVSVWTLEGVMGTQWWGSSVESIPKALSFYNVRSHIVYGTPSPGWIHNSAWGGVLDPSVFPAYAAASLGRYVLLDDVAPVSKPVPVGAIPEAAQAEDMANPRDVQWRGGPHSFKISGTGPQVGALQHFWYGDGKWNGPEVLAVGLVGGQHIEANIYADGSALVVSVLRPDGRTARFTQFAVQVVGQPAWREDELP